MHDPLIHRLLALARAEEFERAAAARRRVPRRRPAGRIEPLDSLTLRFCFPDDARALERLAALDSSELPRQPVLLAEVEGELVAALSLLDGTAVADPFRPTQALVGLLRARARQLAEEREGIRSGRVRRWRRLGLPAWR